MNPTSGRTFNPYNASLTPGGSSGGSASAVASYVAPVAVTEDTGGSTRHPAFQNQNFGYDPTSNHFPNQGNAPIGMYHDQVHTHIRLPFPLHTHTHTHTRRT
jgi:Asp-tRNA(Asn)/Glu-tRNA(Gln) amidotransferase A subunit family amidase